MTNVKSKFTKHTTMLKPSTHIDENRELAIGVSEMQTGG